MHVNTHYSLIRRAIRKTIGDVGPYNPGVQESLENEYGLGSDLRRALLYSAVNDKYEGNGTPIAPRLGPEDLVNKDTVFDIKEFVKGRVAAVIVAFLASMIIQYPPGAMAANSPHIQDEAYDFDDDEENVTLEEFNKYQRHILIFSVFEMDINKDGKIDLSELAVLNKKIQEKADDITIGTFTSVSGAQPETGSLDLDFVLDKLDAERKEPEPVLTPEQLAEQQRREAEEAKRRYASEWDTYLRREGTDVSIRADKLSKNPALFEYDYNGVSQKSSGRIRAAFGLLNKQNRKPEYRPESKTPYISAFTYGGSISLDRSFDPRGAAFEKNALTFRGGGDIEIVDLFFPTQYLTSWIFLETDTNFKKQIFGFESTYQPYAFYQQGNLELGGGRRIRASFAPTLETKYAKVIDAGALSLPYEEYWNMGPAAQLVLSLYGDNRKLAELSSKYTYFWDITGQIGDTYIWDNVFTIPLVKQGENQISLIAEYTLSENGVTGEKTNEFSAGIGWLF